LRHTTSKDVTTCYFATSLPIVESSGVEPDATSYREHLESLIARHWLGRFV
jgi:hypothetical protein